MLPGCQPSEGQVSSAVYLASPSEATEGSIPDYHTCSKQNMVDTLVYSHHGFTHANDASATQSRRQRQLSQEHPHKGLNSFRLLMNNEKESLQFTQAKRTLAGSFRTSTSPRALKSSDKPFLDDDKIIHLIETKLNKFRAQLKDKSLQEKSCSAEDTFNSIKAIPSCSPQAITYKALDDNNHPSNGRRQDSEEKDNGTTSIKAKQSTDYVRIMQEAAAISTKMEEPNPAVLSGPVLNELSKNNVPNVTELSTFSESLPPSYALKITDFHVLKAKEKSNEVLQKSTLGSEGLQLHLRPHSNKVPDVISPVLNNSQDLKKELDWKECLELLETKKVVQVDESKIERQLSDYKREELVKDPQYDNITDDEADRIVSTLDASSQYEDINDELPVHSRYMHLSKKESTEPRDLSSPVFMTHLPKISESTLYEDISDDESQNICDKSVQATAKHSDQILLKNVQIVQTDLSSHCLKQVCHCPYFVETDDGFEEVSLGKLKELEAYKDDSLALSKMAISTQTTQSESDDEWLVIPASDVMLEQKSIFLNNLENHHKVNQNVSNLLQNNQPSLQCFPKIQEFDTFESFMQSKLKQFDKSLKHCVPQLSETTDEAKPESSPCFEAEDSCDTEDSADYPLQTKHNYLTVSSKISSPTSPSHQSSSEDDDYVPQSSKFPKSGSSTFFFPVLTDEESSSPHYTLKPLPAEKKLQGGKKRLKAHKKCTKPYSSGPEDFKQSHNLGSKPLIRLKRHVIEDDSDTDDNGSNSGESQKKPHSSGSEDISTQQRKQSLKPGCGKSSKSTHKQSSSSGRENCKSNLSNSGKLASHQTSCDNRKKKANRKRPDASNGVTQKVTENAQSRVKLSELETISAPDPQVALPNQDNTIHLCRRPHESRETPLIKTFSLDGEIYRASSLPSHKPRQAPISNQVNSYSTTLSTTAKKQLVEGWENNYVPPKVLRKSSCETKPPSAPRSKRRRHNSQGLQTTLMKKSKEQARQLTNALHRQAPFKQKLIVSEGYKGSETYTSMDDPFND